MKLMSKNKAYTTIRDYYKSGNKLFPSDIYHICGLPILFANTNEQSLKEDEALAIWKKIYDEYEGDIRMEKDRVNHPSHYTTGKYEVIDYIRDKLTQEEYTGYCVGNVMKYISRWRHKGGLEDLEKAKVYLTWAIESENRKNSNAPNEKEGV